MGAIEQKVMAELKGALEDFGIYENQMGNWTAPVIVKTYRGTRIVTNNEPDEVFWEAWECDKDALKEAGFGVSKYEDKWNVAFWLSPEDIGIGALRIKLIQGWRSLTGR